MQNGSHFPHLMWVFIYFHPLRIDTVEARDQVCLHTFDNVDATFSLIYLETEYRLFPPVTKFLDLFPRAGYFFNASD